LLHWTWLLNYGKNSQLWTPSEGMYILSCSLTIQVETKNTALQKKICSCSFELASFIVNRQKLFFLAFIKWQQNQLSLHTATITYPQPEVTCCNSMQLPWKFADYTKESWKAEQAPVLSVTWGAMPHIIRRQLTKPRASPHLRGLTGELIKTRPTIPSANGELSTLCLPEVETPTELNRPQWQWIGEMAAQLGLLQQSFRNDMLPPLVS